MGVISFLVSISELIVAIPFLADMETFNPLRELIPTEEDLPERGLIEAFNHYMSTVIASLNVSRNVTENELMEEISKYSWYAILYETILSGIYVPLALIMVLGIHCTKRSLMVPYLVGKMLYTILAIIIGIGITVIFFFYELEYLYFFEALHL